MWQNTVELRAGILHSCQCARRDGLQDSCPRSGCGGSPACMAEPIPLCKPANLVETDKHKYHRPAATSTPPEYFTKKPQRERQTFKNKDSSKKRPDTNLIKMARDGYIDNPPLPPYRFKPCAVHSNKYF